MAESVSTSRRDARRDRIRNHVLDATVRCCQRHGVSAIGISDIAAEAKIGRATLYRHFENFEDVLVALIGREMDELLAELTAVIDSFETIEDKLIEPTVYFLREVSRSPVLRMLFAQDAQLIGRVAMRAAEFRALGAAFCRPVFEQAMREGRIRPGVTLDQYQEWIARLQVSLGFNPHADQNDSIRFRQYLRNFLVPSVFITT